MYDYEKAMPELTGNEIVHCFYCKAEIKVKDAYPFFNGKEEVVVCKSKYKEGQCVKDAKN